MAKKFSSKVKSQNSNKMQTNAGVTTTFFNSKRKRISHEYMDCTDFESNCGLYKIPKKSSKMRVCFNKLDEKCRECGVDVDDDMVREPPFTELSKSILSLFEGTESFSNWAELLGGDDEMKEISDNCMNSFVGDIDEFHDWLELKLDEFFKTFYKDYFYTSDERWNKRRQMIYDRVLVGSKMCKRLTFKRKMVNELNLDIIAFYKHDGDGGYFGEHAQTEGGRQILVLNCIKNYIFRLFLINQNCTP